MKYLLSIRILCWYQIKLADESLFIILRIFKNQKYILTAFERFEFLNFYLLNYV